jgi:PAS domain S-box-containing protein
LEGNGIRRYSLHLIVLTSVIAVAINYYGLVEGISIVIPHIFYIPIILASYFYPRRGVLFAIGIAIVYTGMVAITDPSQTAVIESALARGAIFILVGGVVAYLTSLIQKERQAAEEKEERFRRLASNVPDIIFRVSASDGKFQYLNRDISEISGYSREEFSSAEWYISQVVEPGYRDQVTSYFERLAKGESPEGLEFQIRTKEGSIRWALVKGVLVRGEHGRPVAVEGILSDITPRKRMETIQSRLAAIVSSSSEAIIGKTLDGTITDWNIGAEKLYGYPAGEVIGKPINILVPPGYPDDIPALLEKLRRGESIERYETIRMRKDGKKIQVSLSLSPVKDPSGMVVGASTIAYDISERVRLQKEHEEERRFLQLLMDTIVNPVFYKDRGGRFLGCNAAFANYTGLSREEIIGKTVNEILSPESAALATSKDNELFQNPGTQVYESHIHQPGMHDRDVINYKSTFRSAEGTLQGLVGVIVDITELKSTESALQKANEKLNILSSITRHDILNSLTALLAYTEIALEDVSEPDIRALIRKQLEVEQQIQRQIEFTRYYQDIGVHTPVWHDVDRIIRNAIEMLPLQTLTVVCEVPGLEIYADPLIEKVFYNLMENTLRHGKNATRISCSFRRDGDDLVIEYRDDGVGVPEDAKQAIFQHGFGKHTGLGLFLSREILSITGISISETGEPGKGACFEIRIPHGRYRYPSHQSN